MLYNWIVYSDISIISTKWKKSEKLKSSKCNLEWKKWSKLRSRSCYHCLFLLYKHGGGLVAKSCPTLVTPWTTACQAPLSMRFPKQEYWSGLPFPSPGDVPEPGMEPVSSALAGRVFAAESLGYK